LVKVLQEPSIKREAMVKVAAIASKKESKEKTNIFIDCGEAMIVSHLIEARSPNWRRIPEEAGGMPCATVDSGQLLSAIKVSGIVSTYLHSKMVLNFERNKLSVEGHKKDNSSAKFSVPMTYSGDRVKAHVNRDCFTEMLKAMDGNICMSAPKEPNETIKITANEGKLTYVIMAPKSKD
jgi:DNA polymerase III sliding clamp (beta) subunit (PCNA family)